MLKRLLTAACTTFALAVVHPALAGVVYVPIIVPIQPLMVTSPAQYDAIHSVAVISAIGVNLNMRNVHFLNVADKHLDISGWKLDDEATDMLKRYLGSRFQFRDVPYDRAKLAAIPNGPWDGAFSGFTAFLKSLPTEGIDAFILLRPDLESYDPGLPGIALTNGNGLANTLPVIWANYEIDVIDAHTLKIIGKSFSRVTLRAGVAPSFAGVVVPPVLALDDDFALSDKQQMLLHGIVSKLVEASLVETIRSMNFGVSLPDAGARELVPIPPDKKPYQNVKSVAVVSVIGDQLEERHWGGFWARSTTALAVPDWKLDDTVEADMRTALDKRFAVKDVPVDRHALAQARLLDNDGKLAPSFPGLSATQDVDAYLLAVKLDWASTNYHAGRNGTGILHNSWTIGDDDTGVFASYAIALIDAHTLKIISARAATQSPDRASAQPYLKVDNQLWPAAPPTLSSDQTSQIHAALDNILRDSVQETLLSLGLTDMMIADGPPSAPSQTVVR